MLRIMAAVLCLAAPRPGPAPGAAGDDAVKNGDFKQGGSSWDIPAPNEEQECAVVDLDGAKAVRLRRKKEGAQAGIVQFNLKLKPQTLYRLSVTGRGDAPGHVSLCPQSSKDPEFLKLYKAWAVSSAPLAPSPGPATESLVFDSGLGPDSAFLKLGLDGTAPGSYFVSAVALTELGPSLPAPDELVIAHIGDSITITSYLPFSQRVDSQLDLRIRKAFPALKTRQVNLGADGEWASELFETRRYEKAIRGQNQRIDIAIVRYGGNDSRKYSAKEFKRHLGVLCDALQKDYPAVQIVLGDGPFMFKSDDVNRQYAAYWQAERDLAAERKYPLADVYKRFEKAASVAVYRAENDMHPGVQGVALCADALFAALEPLLKARSK